MTADLWQRNRPVWPAAIVSILLALVVGSAQADWTSWRGPTHNGVSTEAGLVSSWSPEGENLIWHVPFIGRSTPVVFDGRTCVIGRIGEGIERQEIVACYDTYAPSAEKFSDTNKVSNYVKLEDMLADSKVNIVTICTPSGSHRDSAVAAANAGKHVVR